jgi:hypothetical protein
MELNDSTNSSAPTKKSTRAKKTKGERSKPQRGADDSFRQTMASQVASYPSDNAGLPSNPDKLKLGRRSEYRPIYCDWVLAWGAAGKSRAWMAAELGVIKQTLDAWANRNADFSTALQLAVLLSQQWWEDVGQKGLREKTFNAQIWSRSMAARFPEDWREQKKVDVSADTAFMGLWEAVSSGAVIQVADDEAPAA